MSETKPCPWCHKESGKPMKPFEIEWSVLDDDFAQHVHPKMIKYCFSCGRKLEGER